MDSMDFKKIIIFFLILSIFIYWFLISLSLSNPFKFILYCGKKGSGKSTIASAIAQYYSQHKILIVNRDILFRVGSLNVYKFSFERRYMRIYSNFDMFGIHFDNFDPRQLGISFFPDEYSVLFIDEISTIWFNRNFKSFNEDTRKWFVNQRKYKCIVYGFSQSFNIDRSLRQNLVDQIYLVKNLMSTWCYSRKVLKIIDIRNDLQDADSQITESLQFAPIFLRNSIKFYWIPKYVELFDTNQIFK